MVAPITLAKENAIKLIHAVLILWDHYIPSVQEQAREMLVHLIHELVTAKIKPELLSPRKQQIEQLVEAIRRNQNRVIWSYEDNNGKDEDDGGSRVPPAMSSLAKEVVDLFSLSYETFSDLWAKEALHWASTCPVRHLACRSFQVFRCISVSLDSQMLADMLARLSNTIADEQTDYQTFSMEILTTLKVIIGALDPKDLLRYPQLFWTTCACLNTIHEREFFEALGMLETLLGRINIDDPNVIKALLSAQPAKWEGGFTGLQSLVYKGLKSADCLDRTLGVLHRLAELSDSDLVGDSSRLLYGILANLPRFLHQFDLEVFETSSIACAERLSQIAHAQGYPAISQCLVEFATLKHGSGQTFLTSIISAIRSCYFPDQDAQSLIFTMGLLTNKRSWFRLKTMEILCVLIPEVNMKRPEISGHGPDLISPLLRLLQTELCPQALEVMDHIMEVSGNPMERHHIRMSMASGSARAIRKEYERTQSLYGIPMASGWSIPMPAVYSSLTRNNVHAVFLTCGDSEVIQEQTAATPEFEIQGDDGYPDSYFPTQRTATMKSIDTVTDANMGDLVHKLDSLDDFFDEPETANTPTLAAHGGFAGLLQADMHEHGANIYDQQTAPILRRSLARTHSSCSFHNGLAESRPPTSHHHHHQPSMTPGAFTVGALNSLTSIDDLGGPGPSLPNSTKKTPVASASAAPVRQGIHTRSITSPSNNFPSSQPTAMPFVPSLSNAPSFSSDGGADGHGGVASFNDDAVLSDNESYAAFPALSLTTSNPARTLSGPGPGVQTFSGHGNVYGGLRTTPTATSAIESGTGSFSFEGMRRGMRRLTGGKTDVQRGKDMERERVKEMARIRGLSGSGGAQQAGAGGEAGVGQQQGSGAAGQPMSPRVPRVPLEYLSGNILSNAASPTTSP
jgi:Cell morphogenesis C-terminal/Cell morphogenesis central region